MNAFSDRLAAYRGARYAFLHHGQWFTFSLDGAAPGPGLAVPDITLITAWNPGSQERSWAWNQTAQAGLLRALTAARIAWVPAWGGSLPGVEPAWRDEGFGLLGVGREAAFSWGRSWGQDALVCLGPGRCEFLLCQENRSVACFPRPLGFLPLFPSNGPESGR
ncbi:MAG: DUF3293 domain-containing protein [Planctomycetota bacterium]